MTPPKCASRRRSSNVDGICMCPKGTIQRGRECVRPIDCRAPLVPNAAGTDCVCKSGLVLRRGSCVEPVVCRDPATLNSAGTGCNCPRGMISKGNTCVEPEHNPRIDVPLGIPGFHGRGGEGGNPFGGNGGQGGGPRGGNGGQGGGPRRRRPRRRSTRRGRRWRHIWPLVAVGMCACLRCPQRVPAADEDRGRGYRTTPEIQHGRCRGGLIVSLR